MHLLGVLFFHFCTLYLKRTVECRKETINSCMTFQGKGYVRTMFKSPTLSPSHSIQYNILLAFSNYVQLKSKKLAQI